MIARILPLLAKAWILALGMESKGSGEGKEGNSEGNGDRWDEKGQPPRSQPSRAPRGLAFSSHLSAFPSVSLLTDNLAVGLVLQVVENGDP